jgi:hypothetical protein
VAALTVDVDANGVPTTRGVWCPAAVVTRWDSGLASGLEDDGIGVLSKDAMEDLYLPVVRMIEATGRAVHREAETVIRLDRAHVER